MNPCPCGYLGAPQQAPAAARPTRWRATRAGCSGPLLDRIDLQVEVPALPAADLLQARAGRSQRRHRGARCTAARERAMARQGKANQALQGQDNRRTCAARRCRRASSCNLAAARLGWSARSTHRALKVARTIADLAGAEQHRQVTHVAEAMQYRRALRA